MDSGITGGLELTSVTSEAHCRVEGTRTTRHMGRTHGPSHRLLRTSLSAACIVTAALLIADSAAAQSGGASQRPRTLTLSATSGLQVFSTPRNRSSGSFWTPERMRDAEPMDLPLVSPDEIGPAFMPESLPKTGDSRREPGSPPSLDVAPDLDNQLFEPREPEPELEPQAEPHSGVAPFANSPNGALFTNSRVFPPEAVRAYPYRTSGRLFAHDPRNGEFHCSASVIQRRVVVTAGHCVYDAANGYSYTNFRFVPAYDQGEAPFGAWDAEQAWTTRSWVEGGGIFPNAGDFAILVMTDQFVQGEGRAIAEVVGWLGWQADLVANSHVTILGYPGNLDGGHRMQQTAAQTFAPAEPNAAEFGSAHGPGSSGGPYILNFGEMAEGQDEPMQNLVVGIMSYGSTDLTQRRVGTSIINGEFAALFDQACQATRDNCI
jgi:V8-like Glu-specific endopeptidase